MVSEADRNGVTFYWMYDGRGSTAHCVRTWGIAGADVIYNQKIDYDLRGRSTLVTDSYGNKTLYRMNHAGAVVEVTSVAAVVGILVGAAEAISVEARHTSAVEVSAVDTWGAAASVADVP